MYSEKKPSFFSSLSLRLSAWFLLVFGIGLTGILFAGYILLERSVMGGPERAVYFELEEARTMYEKQGKGALQQHINNEADEYGVSRVFYRVFQNDDRPLYTSDMGAWSGLPINRVVKGKQGVTLFLNENLRPVRVVNIEIASDLSVEGGIDVSQEYALLHNYQAVLPFVGFLVLGLAGLTGYGAVFRTVRRIDRLTTLTKEISGNKLGLRVPVENPEDELGRLSITLNEMLERIESLVTSIKQVSEDVAHELRSPITKLRARAELALSETNSTYNQIGMAENTIEECDELLNLINSMLEISEADASVLQLKREDVDLVELIGTAVEFFEPLAEQKSITIDFAETGSVIVDGDTAKLQRAISNILDNAIKYSRVGGHIEISVFAMPHGSVEIKIADNGIGIAEEELPRLFERFFRVDSSRSAPGNGLGLTMSRALIKAHQGDVSVASQAGQGTEVTIVLNTTVRS